VAAEGDDRQALPGSANCGSGYREEMELREDAIVLRPWRDDDAPRVYAACQDQDLQRWLPDLPRPYTHDDARAFVTDALGLGPYQFAITERANVVGSIGLRIGKHQTGGVGYWVAWRRVAEVSQHARCEDCAAAPWTT